MQIEQTSNQVDEGPWKWSVWLEGTPTELERVDKVVYHLHPSFPDPIVERTDRSSKFRLDASGWGTFVLRIEIHRAGEEVEQMSHRLRFARNKPEVFVSNPANEQTEFDAVKAAMHEAKIGVTSGQDVGVGDDDPFSTVWQSIDRAKALVLVNGSTPSRWVMQEVQAAESLGKPIFSLGENSLYATGKATKVGSMNELLEKIAKLPE